MINGYGYLMLLIPNDLAHQFSALLNRKGISIPHKADYYMLALFYPINSSANIRKAAKEFVWQWFFPVNQLTFTREQ
jgi:hypothetical protein